MDGRAERVEAKSCLATNGEVALARLFAESKAHSEMTKVENSQGTKALVKSSSGGDGIFAGQRNRWN